MREIIVYIIYKVINRYLCCSFFHFSSATESSVFAGPSLSVLDSSLSTDTDIRDVPRQNKNVIYLLNWYMIKCNAVKHSFALVTKKFYNR